MLVVATNAPFDWLVMEMSQQKIPLRRVQVIYWYLQLSEHGQWQNCKGLLVMYYLGLIGIGLEVP